MHVIAPTMAHDVMTHGKLGNLHDRLRRVRPCAERSTDAAPKLETTSVVLVLVLLITHERPS